MFNWQSLPSSFRKWCCSTFVKYIHVIWSQRHFTRFIFVIVRPYIGFSLYVFSILQFSKYIVKITYCLKRCRQKFQGRYFVSKHTMRKIYYLHKEYRSAHPSFHLVRISQENIMNTSTLPCVANVNLTFTSEQNYCT